MTRSIFIFVADRLTLRVFPWKPDFWLFLFTELGFFRGFMMGADFLLELGLLGEVFGSSFFLLPPKGKGDSGFFCVSVGCGYKKTGRTGKPSALSLEFSSRFGGFQCQLSLVFPVFLVFRRIFPGGSLWTEEFQLGDVDDQFCF